MLALGGTSIQNPYVVGEILCRLEMLTCIFVCTDLLYHILLSSAFVLCATCVPSQTACCLFFGCQGVCPWSENQHLPQTHVPTCHCKLAYLSM